MNMDNSPTEKTNEEGEKSTAAAQSTGSLAGTGKVSSPASRKEQNEWNKMFDRLAAFKKKNGHVNVDKTDLELAVWGKRSRRSTVKCELPNISDLRVCSVAPVHAPTI